MERKRRSIERKELQETILYLMSVLFVGVIGMFALVIGLKFTFEFIKNMIIVKTDDNKDDFLANQ